MTLDFMVESMSDPKSIIESLDISAIRERLEELAAEESALRVLLRAATARARSKARDGKEPQIGKAVPV